MVGDPLTAALHYASLGWPVFPLHTPDATGRCSCTKQKCAIGKHPRTNNVYHDATTDKAIIEAWWQKWSDANIGICTIEASGIVVLDVDPRNGGHYTLEGLEAQHGRLPDTVMSFTGGGGTHYYFQAPRVPIHGGISVLGPGLDVKAEGCGATEPA